MKRVVISVVLFLGIFTLALGSYFYITGNASDIIGKVELVQKSFETEDYEKAKFLSAEVRDDWNNISANQHLIINSNCLLDITELIERLNVLVVFEKDAESDFKAECGALLSQLYNFYENQKPTYKNVL